MPRLISSVVALVFLTAPVSAQLADGGDGSLARALAVNKAMAVARNLLQAGKSGEAVAVLEANLRTIDGNEKYLALLRDAYCAHVRELHLTGELEKARQIRHRLKLIDADAERHLNSADPPREPAEVAPAAPSPVADNMPPPPTSALELKARGQSGDESDSSTSDCLVRAEAAFRKGEYAEAGALYAKAAQANPHLGATTAERWAYCKLYVVVERLNTAEAVVADELEREVAAAMKLAPKLEAFGQTVLGKVRQKAGNRSAVAIRPRGKSADGWEVVESSSFRARYRANGAMVEQLLKAAEQHRATLYQTWHGASAGAWAEPCELVLHATAADYSRETEKPAALSGHSTLQTKDNRVVSRRIDLRADDPDLLIGTLPHELTHVVLADLFPSTPLPRWADEGAAVLAESRPKVERYLKRVTALHRNGHLVPVRQLMQQADYPEAARVTAFYVQSVSVVDYLVSLKGPREFAMYLQYAPRYGHEKALERQYGIKGFADLQARWERHALSGSAAASPPASEAAGR